MPSGAEWIIVLVIVLVIFGGTQVPKLARNFGRAHREFKDGLAQSQHDEEPPSRATTGTRIDTHNDN